MRRCSFRWCLYLKAFPHSLHLNLRFPAPSFSGGGCRQKHRVGRVTSGKHIMTAWSRSWSGKRNSVTETWADGGKLLCFYSSFISTSSKQATKTLNRRLCCLTLWCSRPAEDQPEHTWTQVSAELGFKPCSDECPSGLTSADFVSVP